eukprot:scaffold4899_cov184-Ochromonas_danica.AAC.2
MSNAKTSEFTFSVFQLTCERRFNEMDAKFELLAGKLDYLSLSVLRQEKMLELVAKFVADAKVSNEPNKKVQTSTDVVVEGRIESVLSDLGKRVDEQVSTLIINNPTLNDIRSVCRSQNYLYSFEHQTIPNTIGYMLCTYRQLKTKNVEIMVIENYEAHKRTRKLFTTFVTEAIRKSGERRVITAGHERVKTSCGQNYSVLVLERVAKAIMVELFYSRTDLFFNAVEWASEDEHNNMMMPRNKRSRDVLQKTSNSTNAPNKTIVWKQYINRVELGYQVLLEEIRRVAVDRRNYDRRVKTLSSKSSDCSDTVGENSLPSIDQQDQEEEEDEVGSYDPWCEAA